VNCSAANILKPPRSHRARLDSHRRLQPQGPLQGEPRGQAVAVRPSAPGRHGRISRRDPLVLRRRFRQLVARTEPGVQRRLFDRRPAHRRHSLKHVQRALGPIVVTQWIAVALLDVQPYRCFAVKHAHAAGYGALPTNVSKEALPRPQRLSDRRSIPVFQPKLS
jgi:hypothetical protein